MTRLSNEQITLPMNHAQDQLDNAKLSLVDDNYTAVLHFLSQALDFILHARVVTIQAIITPKQKE